MCKIPNLPLEEIDPKCREFVYLLNKYGFKTQFCCQGHDDKYNTSYHIIFDKEVQDNKIDELICILGHCGEFYKWKRGDAKGILTNWMYKCDWYKDSLENQTKALLDCYKLKNYFSKKKYEYWVEYSFHVNGTPNKIYKQRLRG